MTKIIFFLFLSSVLLTSRFAAAICTDSVQTATSTVNTPVPAALKGATIFVQTADGTVYPMSAETFKVVPRSHPVTSTSTTRTCTAEAAKRPNRISLLAGYGAQPGLKTRQNGAAAEVESKVGAVGGAMYQRLLNERVSVGVQVQTSETALGTIGLEF